MEEVQVSIFPDGRLDTDNAAVYTRKSVKTLAMYRCAGTGPKFRKVGGRIFYLKSDLDEWLGSFPTVTSTAQASALANAA